MTLGGPTLLIPIAVLAMAACDAKPGDSGAPATDASVAQDDNAKAKAKSKPDPKPVEAKAGKSAQATATKPKRVEPAAPTPEPDTGTPVVDPRSPLEILAAKADPHSNPSKAAWGHLRAKEYDKAQPLFAQAAMMDRVAWKHPYNLACAAALGGDTEVAQVGLVEAIARDAATVGPKARRDEDLASVRGQPWFERVLAGLPAVEAPPSEAPPSEAPPSEAPPSEAPPSEAPPSEFDPMDLPNGPVTSAPGAPTPMSRSQKRQLREALAKRHQFKPPVRGSVVYDNAGATEVWAVYETPLFDACVAEKKNRKACRKKFIGDPDDGTSNQMECARHALVHASFGPSLAVDKPISIMKSACALGKVRRFEAVDIDADGAKEIVIDLTWNRQSTGYREGEVEEGGRFVRMLRLDGTIQYEFAFDWFMSDMTPTQDQAQRFTLNDTNGDGHPDLEILFVEMDGVLGPTFDEEAFPHPGDVENPGAFTLQTWPYDKKSDRWVEPKKSP